MARFNLKSLPTLVLVFGIPTNISIVNTTQKPWLFLAVWCQISSRRKGTRDEKLLEMVHLNGQVEAHVALWDVDDRSDYQDILY